MGELLSSKSSTMLTENYTDKSSFINTIDYWVMNKDTKTSCAWYVNDYGEANSILMLTYRVRLVITVIKDIDIKSRTGTWNNLYKV